jgi:hypothetical protein
MATTARTVLTRCGTRSFSHEPSASDCSACFEIGSLRETWVAAVDSPQSLIIRRWRLPYWLVVLAIAPACLAIFYADYRVGLGAILTGIVILGLVSLYNMSCETTAPVLIIQKDTPDVILPRLKISLNRSEIMILNDLRVWVKTFDGWARHAELSFVVHTTEGDWYQVPIVYLDVDSHVSELCDSIASPLNIPHRLIEGPSEHETRTQ